MAGRIPKEMFDAFTLLKVFPRTQEPSRFPKATFDALMLLSVFPPPTNHPAVTPFVATRLNAFAIDETLRVVDERKGIVKVSKLATKLLPFDVKPSLIIFEVVTEFAE